MIWILTAGLGLLVAVQALLVWRFSSYLRTQFSPQRDESFRPRVAVILCARGADPNLAACLSALARQDWPDYRVYLITDHAQDPAVEILQSVSKTLNTERIEHRVAGGFDPFRSLKCNSLVWVCERLDPRVEVVALIDADVVPETNWLQRLVAPLSEPFVAASYGMRWFESSSAQVGTHLRAIWNAAAIVQMQAYDIAWGGSLAIRRQALEQSGLLARWRFSLFEDVMVAPQMAKKRWQTRMCHDLVLINREEIRLPNAMRWMTRQLIDVKLYHPLWPLVLLHAIGIGGMLLVVLTCGLVYLIIGKPIPAAFCLLLLIAFQTFNAVLLGRIKSAVRYAARPYRLGPAIPLSFRMLLATAMIPLCQLVHLIAAIGAATQRSVRWRGLEYEIVNQNKIRLRKYIPMCQVAKATPNANAALDSID